MTSLVAVPLDEGGVVVVEMEQPPDGVVKTGRAGEIVGQAAQSLEAALDTVTPAARSALAKLRDTGPQGITLEFGLRLTAEAGAMITKSTGECNFKVTLHWERRGGADA